MRTKTERTTTSFRFDAAFRAELKAVSRAAAMSQAELLEHCFRQCYPVAGAPTDSQMIDWLADVDNGRGYVLLSSECVLAHMDNLRDSIRATMGMQE